MSQAAIPPAAVGGARPAVLLRKDGQPQRKRGPKAGVKRRRKKAAAAAAAIVSATPASDTNDVSDASDGEADVEDGSQSSKRQKSEGGGHRKMDHRQLQEMRLLRDREEASARATWHLFHTDLLRAVLHSDGGEQALQALGERGSDREAIITALLAADLRVPTGEADDQLQQLQEVWATAMGTDEVAHPGPYPGFHDDDANNKSGSSKRTSASATAKALISAGSPPAADKRPARSPSAGGQLTSPPRDGKLANEEMIDLTLARACLTCLTPQETGGPAQWICKGYITPGVVCGLRGDLDGEHAANKRIAAAQARAPPSTPSTGAGQSTEGQTRALAATQKQNKIDVELDRLRLAGPDHILFTRPSSVSAEQEAALVKAAYEGVRLSLGAKAYVYPSASLISLVQSGRLAQVGYAIPEKVASAAEEEPVVVTISGNKITSASATAPPVVSDLRAFNAAIFGTILPALAARPQAQLQWVSLARTIATIEERFGSVGWSSAKKYLDAFLPECVRQQESFCKVDADFIQQNLSGQTQRQHTPAAANVSEQARGAFSASKQKGTGTSANKEVGPFCRDFNNKGCARNPCSYRHVCELCGSPTHAKASCGTRVSSSNRPPSSVVSAPAAAATSAAKATAAASGL
jgi:hypothetical protein